MGVLLLTCITAKETIKGKATDCFSQSLAPYPNSATAPLSVATGSEVYSSTMAASLELFDLAGRDSKVKDCPTAGELAPTLLDRGSPNFQNASNSSAGCRVGRSNVEVPLAARPFSTKSWLVRISSRGPLRIKQSTALN